MPAETTVGVQITCDNPNCPGNELDPNDRAGWTFVNTEVYGEPTEQHVYCCAACAGTLTDVLAEAETARAEEEQSGDAEASDAPAVAAGTAPKSSSGRKR